jgi:hypothetical protein
VPRILKPREGHPVPEISQLPAEEIGEWIPSENEPAPIPPLKSRLPQLKAGDPRTKAIASAGGRAAKAKRDQLKAITGLGVRLTSKLMTDPNYAEYVEAALEFAQHEIARLARDVGGGVCPPPAAACVVAAARAMIWSAKATDECDGKAAISYEAAMKQQLLCAHEFCVSEARLRKNRKSSHAKIEEGLASLGDDDNASKD